MEMAKYKYDMQNDHGWVRVRPGSEDEAFYDRGEALKAKHKGKHALSDGDMRELKRHILRELYTDLDNNEIRESYAIERMLEIMIDFA
jgi:hypothetical protein